MSMSIEELTALYGTYAVNGLSQGSNNTVSTTDESTKDSDSYISSLADNSENQVIPSENYNDLGREILAANKTSETRDSLNNQGLSNDTAAGSVSGVSSDSAGGVSGSQGGSSGGTSDSEDDTETEIVTINGQTYLQTTTTDSNGNESVTRVPIG